MRRISFPDGARANRLFSRRDAAIAFIAGLILIVVGHDLYQTWRAGVRVIEESRRDVTNLAQSVARHVEGALRLGDAALIGFVERVETDGTGPPQRERLRHLIARQLANSPALQGLTVVDANGDAVVNGQPATPAVNVADRQFFEYHRANVDRGAYARELVQSRISGEWVFGVSRRFDHPDGSFAGVVSATIDVRYFQNFYSTFDLGHDGIAALFHGNGMLLARQPFLAAAFGSDQSGNSLFTEQIGKASSGTYEKISGLDGVERIFGFLKVTGYPFVAVVGLGKNEQLAGWRATAVEHLLLAGVVILPLGFFAIRQTAYLATARDRAENASAAKSRFLTGITHELRTPLHGILGYAELLKLEGGLNPAQSERVRAMIAAGEHLLDLINAVLDVSQIEANRLRLHPVDIELGDLARGCLDVVRPAAEAKGLTPRLTLDAPVQIHADPVRLRQVLINLLGNAVKFTASGTIELHVRKTPDSDFVHLEVIDTGPGIGARHRDKLFQPFERLDPEAVSGIEGAGLGLALAERLVSAMGGRVGYSDNPGGGSIFWLVLPASKAKLGAADAVAAGAGSREPPLRVLVVDDDAINRDIARKFLQLAGHTVDCLDNGEAAVKAAAEEDFDVILMDVRMPDMDGLEATRMIRALPAPRGTVPVIAVTAQAFAEQIEVCRAAGMTTHLSKPFRPAALLAAIRQVTVRSPSVIAPTPANAASLGLPVSPVFDRAAFEDTVESLTAAEIPRYLHTLIARAEALALGLRRPGILARAEELAASAHSLAGGAAILGFLSLSDAGRDFEHAAGANAPEMVALAGELTRAIEVAVIAMRGELAEMANADATG